MYIIYNEYYSKIKLLKYLKLISIYLLIINGNRECINNYFKIL